MPGGRPTKYCDEILEITKDYIKNFSKHGDKIPSVAGLACAIGTSRDTIHDWAKHKDKKQFSDILKELQTMQEKTLLAGGLGNTFNPTICKLVMSKHNYHDRQDVSSPPGEPLQVKYTVEGVD